MLKPTHRSNITLPEIFEYVQSLDSQSEKLEALRSYSNMKQLKWFVNAMYNYDFNGFDIPPYTPNMQPVGLTQTIGRNLTRLDAAIKLHQAGRLERYNDIMTIVLESVSRDEALLLERLFANKKIDGVSKAMWKKIYPEFFRS